MKVHCAHDKMVSVSDLKSHPKNRNKHPDSQIERLAEILKYQGFRYPVKVSKLSGFVTSGHGRILAAKANGWTEVPVSFQDYDDEVQEYADVQSDNAIAAWAELDLSGINLDALEFGDKLNIDMLGLENFSVVEPEVIEPQCEPDEMPEHVETRCKPGDLWEMGASRLKVGDSTSVDDIGDLFRGDVAELCFTSPPYADQREYNGGKELSTEHLATFIRTAKTHAKYFVVNLGYARKNGEVFQYWDDYIREARDCGLKFLSWNIWDKGECGSIGNQTAMFGIQHEWVFVFGNEPKKLNLTVANKETGKKKHGSIRQTDGTTKKRSDSNETVNAFSQLKTIVLQTPQKARNHGLDHPAMFPVDFPKMFIEAMTQPGEIVFEPFGGSGTTLIAAAETGRRCRIMELDPKYADMILGRWEKYTGQKAQLVSGE